MAQASQARGQMSRYVDDIIQGSMPVVSSLAPSATQPVSTHDVFYFILLLYIIIYLKKINYYYY